MNGRKEHIIQSIRKMSKEVIPETGKVILFGSQARGDSHEESDWDLLILLDKDKLTSTDYDDFAYPFFELGWHINAQIHPPLHTFKEWEQRSYLPFHKNITKEGIELRQSGDYGDMYDATEEEIIPYISKTEASVSKMEELITLI